MYDAQHTPLLHNLSLFDLFEHQRDDCVGYVVQSLLISDVFQPQIAPLTAAELELLHWIVSVTRSVGFYNSNAVAGASQAHRHMQFVPLDQIWHLRNADAPHVR